MANNTALPAWSDTGINGAQYIVPLGRQGGTTSLNYPNPPSTYTTLIYVPHMRKYIDMLGLTECFIFYCCR